MASAIDLTHSDDDGDDEIAFQGERQVEPRARPAAPSTSSPSRPHPLPPAVASFASHPTSFRPSPTNLGGFIGTPPVFGVSGFAFDPRQASASSSSALPYAPGTTSSSTSGGRQTLPPTYPLPPGPPSHYGRASHTSPTSSLASSSRTRLPVPPMPRASTSAAEVIDVDSLPDLPPPPPVAPRPAPPPENKPHLVGMLETSALIMYPDNPFLQPVIPPGQTLLDRLPKGEFMQQAGEEWARIKVKYKPLPPGSAPGSPETINLLPHGAPSSTTDPFGVVASNVASVLGGFLSRGLVRVEGFIRRSRDPPSRMCASLYLFVLTIPPNIKYVSDQLAEHSLFLLTPKLPYEPAWFQNCLYYNPHISHPGIYDNYSARKKTLSSGGLSTQGPNEQQLAAQRALNLQRSQVDEVFESLKGGDELDETDPGPLIGTTLYPHQRKALSFLREREAEKRPPTGLSKKGWSPPDRPSLWTPVEDSTPTSSRKSKKVNGWRNKVTEKVSSSKPKECRGAILADDMGLGKSLSVVSLIASTLTSARKYEVKPLEDPPSPSEIVAQLDDGANDFAGAIFNMPEMPDWTGKGPKKSDKQKVIERVAETVARRSRVKARTRATLIVCPLTTVSHWEDQLMDHWDGAVTVFASAGGGGTRRNGRAAINARKKKKRRSGDSSSDDSDDDDEKELRVYTYHGTNRSSDYDYIGDFDVVITTYSTLTAEFSKQTKTGEDDGGSAAASAAVSGTTTPAHDDGDSDVQEMDANGQPLGRPGAKPVKKRKRGKGAISNLGMAKATEATSPLQQLDWFRVVLDEAHFIKDANTVAARASCYLEAQRRLAITGTPIQNKLDDLWALIKFIRLEPFDDRAVWQEFITAPAKSGNSLGLARLLIIMRHITLRRTKETRLASGKTLLDLPERQDEIRFLNFTDVEREIYDKYFEDSARDFNNMIDQKEDDVAGGNSNAGALTAPGIASTSYVNILQKILRLRQICDHRLLMSDSSASIPDEDDSSEPLDYETASAAITTHGLTRKRAASVLAWMKEEAVCDCLECKAPMDDLATHLSGLALGAEEEASAEATSTTKQRKGKGKKLITGVLTKCQHLFCLECFQKSVYAKYPKSINGVGRSCPQCTVGLRLSTDCIELAPLDGKATATKTPSRRSRQKRVPRTGEDLVTSSKINHLLEDLLAFSKLNRHSRNFAGQRNGMAGVDKNGFVQEPDEDDDMAEMVVMGGGGGEGEDAAQSVITAAPGEDLVTNPSSALNGSSTILHGNPPTTKIEHNVDFSAAPEQSAGQSNGTASASAGDVKPSSVEKEAAGPVDNGNDFSFDASAHNKAIIIKDVHDRPALGEPWASDMATGKPIKSVVFSQWTTMLDRIEDAICHSGIGYDRLDGSMKLDERVKAMDRLKTDPACEVLLVSLRAGGVGLNLTAASRVYVMDPYWNPAVENQAVDRVHRLGQTRPVVTIKYIMHDSMEEKMLEVQARKTKVAGLTLAQNISRKELHEQRMEDLKTLFS